MPTKYKGAHLHRSSLIRLSLASKNSQKKKNTSKMKKHRNHSQLKEQENSPKAVNNETDLCILTDIEFKREVLKTLKELREDINSNADSFRKELRKYEEQRKTIKFICRATN